MCVGCRVQGAGCSQRCLPPVTFPGLPCTAVGAVLHALQAADQHPAHTPTVLDHWTAPPPGDLFGAEFNHWGVGPRREAGCCSAGAGGGSPGCAAAHPHRGMALHMQLLRKARGHLVAFCLAPRCCCRRSGSLRALAAQLHSALAAKQHTPAAASATLGPRLLLLHLPRQLPHLRCQGPARESKVPPNPCLSQS
jgi:hypothetical protein